MTLETTGTTGKWCQPAVPHKGWTFVGFDDLGEPSAICEMCETQTIRYVHYMEHPNYPQQLGCGCVCAGRMEEDYEGARRREAVFRSVTARRHGWLSRKWRMSSKGNPYINAPEGRVTVGPGVFALQTG
jgi:hypothetical protein